MSVSDPDEMARLKAKVDLYEKEYADSIASFGSRLNEAREKKFDERIIAVIAGEHFLQVTDLNNKLLAAYREYAAALEKLVPR